MRRAAEAPGASVRRDDLHEGLRAARHGRYLIFFVEAEGEVRIVRVIHGARDLPRLLGD